MNRNSLFLGTSSGRICDGYGDSSRSLSALFLPRLRTVANFCDSTEAYYVRLFVDRTVGQLTAFFPDELWRTSVLQMAHAEAGIRHALVSFSAYHDAYTKDSMNEDQPLALRHYNLSIRELGSSTETTPLTLNHLVSCAIFICIEVCVPFILVVNVSNMSSFSEGSFILRTDYSRTGWPCSSISVNRPP